jgi:hypothetical protein
VSGFRGRRVAVGAALAAMAVSTLTLTGAHAAAGTPLFSTVGPKCVKTVDTPKTGESTLTDSTTPTLTSVTWAHSTITVKPKTTVRVTIKLKDDCSGAGDVVLELHNSKTKNTDYIEANYVSSTITTTSINDTWNVDVPLYGTDAGNLSIAHVSVLSGFTSLVYDSTKTTPLAPDDVIDVLPHDDQITDADYHNLTPPKAAKIAVKAGATLSTDATPEPGKVGHWLSVKATLKAIHASTYVAVKSTYVTIQYKPAGSTAWHTLKKLKTSSSGVVSAKYKPLKKGTYAFRTVFAGSTYVGAVTSAADSVKVS